MPAHTGGSDRPSRGPGRFAMAGLRRLFPGSEQFGFPWKRLDDGSITFHERGFVAADSPSALLGRQFYEADRIEAELVGVRVEQSLEIGCGFGRLSPYLARHAAHHVAVDINEDALALARAYYPTLEFRLASAGRLPFPDASMGLAVTWTVLQHVPPDRIAAACRDVERVLTHGGLLLMCEATSPHAAAAPPRLAHTWARTLDEYAEIFEQCDLDRTSQFEEFPDALAGLAPGTIMVFRRRG